MHVRSDLQAFEGPWIFWRLLKRGAYTPSPQPRVQMCKAALDTRRYNSEHYRCGSCPKGAQSPASVRCYWAGSYRKPREGLFWRKGSSETRLERTRGKWGGGRALRKPSLGSNVVDEPWRMKSFRQLSPTSLSKGFPAGTRGKEPACQCRRRMRVQSLGREERATCSSILACRMSWTEEPGGLQSMGLQRVRYDWRDLARTHAALINLFNPSASSPEVMTGCVIYGAPSSISRRQQQVLNQPWGSSEHGPLSGGARLMPIKPVVIVILKTDPGPFKWEQENSAQDAARLSAWVLEGGCWMRVGFISCAWGHVTSMAVFCLWDGFNGCY